MQLNKRPVPPKKGDTMCHQEGESVGMGPNKKRVENVLSSLFVWRIFDDKNIVYRHVYLRVISPSESIFQ